MDFHENKIKNHLKQIIMKKIIFLSVLAAITISGYSQTPSWTAGTGKLYTNPTTTNIGIGTTNPTAKLHVNGNIFLDPVETLNGWNCSYLQWRGHHLIMGSPVGNYYHNSLTLMPGGSTQGALASQFRMYTATAPNQQDLKIFINSQGGTYFNNPGNFGIGTSDPIEKLHVNGKILLEPVEIIDTRGYSYLHWNSHYLVLGTPVGNYANNSVDLKPGGATQGTLHSQFRMYTATAPNQQSLKIYINSNAGTYFNNPGNFGIGTDNPRCKLDVNGTIRAKEVLVTLSNWPDYVFENDYPLMNLREIETFIKENKHLPEIPSACEVEENGVNLGEMQSKLLQKIEELMLYTIEQQKEIEELKDRISEMEKKGDE
jgi:hypothetical protein